jgi:hypothetical protein
VVRAAQLFRVAAARPAAARHRAALLAVVPGLLLPAHADEGLKILPALPPAVGADLAESVRTVSRRLAARDSADLVAKLGMVLRRPEHLGVGVPASGLEERRVE